MDAFEILVVILSVTLAIFLVLAIILTVLLIKLANKAHRVADSAEIIADNAVEATNTIFQLATPAVILQQLIKTIKK